MKLNQLITEVDVGDLQLAAQHDSKQQETKSHTAGFWLVDKRTARRLAGPFASAERARSHQQNRRDKIPADAVVRQYN